MTPHEAHLSHSQLISALDGELSPKDRILVESHLAACWSCRARRQELESAIADFVHVHRERFNGNIPPADGPRALLKARIAQLQSATQPRPLRLNTFHRWQTALTIATAVVVLTATLYLARQAWTAHPSEPLVAVIKPDPSLTPGATVLLSRGELCRASNANNKAVPLSLQRRIFDEYGIHTRRVNSYEVDYLITPALGGADDIHNLWPQSRNSTAWNAQVKDALEDHLRNMVCDGQIDLAVAQREMATDWIQAYKKYFHTDRPLARYR